jgi:hypothetical protein
MLDLEPRGDFAREKHLIPADPELLLGLPEALPHALLIPVYRRRVNKPVSLLQRLKDGLLRNISLELKRPKPYQGQGGHSPRNSYRRGGARSDVESCHDGQYQGQLPQHSHQIVVDRSRGGWLPSLLPLLLPFHLPVCGAVFQRGKKNIRVRVGVFSSCLYQVDEIGPRVVELTTAAGSKEAPFLGSQVLLDRSETRSLPTRILHTRTR